jgi:hypothetical protein
MIINATLIIVWIKLTGGWWITLWAISRFISEPREDCRHCASYFWVYQLLLLWDILSTCSIESLWTSLNRFTPSNII